MSHRPSINSETAILIAESDAAQAASTTELMPPKSKRFVIRPEITFPNIPGKEFSFHPIYAFFIFSIICGISAPLIPLLFRAFSQIGVCNLEVSGVISF